MILKADLIQKEVDPPHNKWCACGHIASDTYRRAGPDSLAEPTRFFEVSDGNIRAIYCEPCLVIAHWLSQQENKK